MAREESGQGDRAGAAGEGFGRSDADGSVQAAALRLCGGGSDMCVWFALADLNRSLQ